MNSTMHSGKYRKSEGVDVSSNKRRDGAETVLEDLPEEILTRILSRLNLKEVGRTSVLSHRWKDLWKFTPVSLEFDAWGTVGAELDRKKFKAWVNHILKSHKAQQVDSFIVRFNVQWRADFIHEWVSHALKKEARNIEINLSPSPTYHGGYVFPDLYKLLDSYGVKSSFGFLKSLKLVDVGIHDETLRCFLVSCTNLESLTICGSRYTRHPCLVDPLPKLKYFAISCCYNMKSVEISVASLASFSYSGPIINLSFDKIPNLSEVTLGGKFCQSFLLDANKHSSYSFQLETLKLDLPFKLTETPPRDPAYYESPYLPRYCKLKYMEVTALSVVGRSLLFCTKLIEACPLLHKFRIKVKYTLSSKLEPAILLPNVSADDAPIFQHESLKVVELAGYIGCPSEEEFLTQLLKVAPCLEVVTIDTENDFQRLADEFDCVQAQAQAWDGEELALPTCVYAKSRMEAVELAEGVQSKFPQETQVVII
ncbi:FBD-associated F-box protein At1g66310-like [Andrographis paniculata]|uniref:FBD-associated F-box protein At1g66310-like n=1 Tax=Andrographis paniculata TaxID=175694 RepID=UPI0021E98589|nr:FBD-associated F-box protein At1g66310-like [Andrographis paniculata]